MDEIIASCVYSFGAQRRIPLRASEASFDMGEYQSSVGELVKTKTPGKIKGERSEFILPLIIPGVFVRVSARRRIFIQR